VKENLHKSLLANLKVTNEQGNDKNDLIEKIKNAREGITSPMQLEGVDRTKWTSIEITPAERQNYLAMIQNPTSTIHRCGAYRNLHKTVRNCTGYEPKDLPNGKKMEVEELQSIQVFSSTFYKIINQGLRNHPNDYPIALKETYTHQEYAEAMRAVAIECSTVISSALNKLPPYEGLLMRGTALKPEDLPKYHKGNIIFENKFSGGTIDFEVCKTFAERTAGSYPGCVPVVMCWESKTSKSIQDFSFLPNEAERLYPPGQGFQVIEVEEGIDELKGFKVIYLKEIE